MSQHMNEPERLPEHYEAPVQEPEKYSPRPKGQIIFAWVLLGIVIASILNICYWEIFG